MGPVRGAGVDVLDLSPLVREAVRTDTSRAAAWFDGHMTDAGNRWVAERVAERLAKLR